MEVNENWVQFQGKFIIPFVPDRNKYLIISGRFEHGDMVEKNNQDETVDHIYKVTPLDIMIQNGEDRIRAEVKKHASWRLRRALWKHYSTNNGNAEFYEDYYQNFINKLIGNLDEVVNLIGMKIENE